MDKLRLTTLTSYNGDMYLRPQEQSKDFSISSVLDRFEVKTEPKSSEDKATHKRAYYVELTRKMLGKDQEGKDYTFGSINGLTKDWSILKLEYRYNYCSKHPKSPAITWWWLRKEDKKKKLSTVTLDK